MASIEEVENELKRLKKDDLIRILTLKKVPGDVVLSEKVLEFLNIVEKPTENMGFRNSTEVNPNLKSENADMTIIKLQCDLKVAKIEVESSKRLIRELERSVNNQEELIGMLKKEQNNKEHPSHSRGYQNKTNNVATSSAMAADRLKAHTDDGQKNVKKGENDNLTLQNNNKQIEPPTKKVIWGDNEIPSSQLSFAAAAKQAWLHVGKVQLGTEANKIKSYLESKFHNHTFRVEPLPVNENATTMSFKVGADYSLLDKLNNPSIWPKGVAVKRFSFFRGRGQRSQRT